MKKRILSGWNFRRVMYASLGTIIVVQSLVQHEWFGVFIGAYFASMGIFAFGCASGTCFAGTCYTGTKSHSSLSEEGNIKKRNEAERKREASENVFSNQ